MTHIPWYSYVALSTMIGVLAFGAAAPPPTVAPPTGGGSPPAVYANLSIIASNGPSPYVYTPTTLSLPSNVPLVITISNYDPHVGPVAGPASAEVLGAVGGVMVVHQGPMFYTTHFLQMNQVSHTFTIRTPQFFLNVPIPPEWTVNSPTTVTFTIVLPAPGPYPFSCAVLTSIGQFGLRGTLTAT